MASFITVALKSWWCPQLKTCLLFSPVQGMACVGRTKQCTIVPSNHFGPIPGVPVGSMWKFRVQVREYVGLQAYTQLVRGYEGGGMEYSQLAKYIMR